MRERIKPIVGHEYNIPISNRDSLRARFNGVLNAQSGMLWDFVATEKSYSMAIGCGGNFRLPYDGRGLEIIN